MMTLIPAEETAEWRSVVTRTRLPPRQASKKIADRPGID